MQEYSRTKSKSTSEKKKLDQSNDTKPDSLSHGVYYRYTYVTNFS